MGRHEDALARVAKSKNAQRGSGGGASGGTKAELQKHENAKKAVGLLHEGVVQGIHHGSEAVKKVVKSKVHRDFHGVVDHGTSFAKRVATDKVNRDFADHKKSFA